MINNTNNANNNGIGFTCTHLLVSLFTVFVVLGFTQQVEADITVSSPEWEIELDDFGYSDYMGDFRPGYEGRDYLSGEWGAAVSYKVGAAASTSPTWLTPSFESPDWTTNSDFSVLSTFTSTGTNVEGHTIYKSSIANSDLRIDILAQVRDSVSGIEQGMAPASIGGVGSSSTSARYILQQSYDITNISGANITDLKLYQFLHSLEAQTALYDNRDYGGAYGNYHYDITENGESYGYNSNTGQYYLHDDTIGLHSEVAPSGWEVGRYGIEGVDNHDFDASEDIGDGKPGTGVHLSVESGSLNGSDNFSPTNRWVSGAQEHTLVELADGATVSRDFLLGIGTTSNLEELPGTDPLDPILPEFTIDPGFGGGWVFEFGAPAGETIFIDPIVAIGYDYVAWSDIKFQSVLLPDVGDGVFELIFEDPLTQEFTSVSLEDGVVYDFGFGGVNIFTILGIEADAGLDPNDPLAFVTGLTFTGTGIVEMAMMPIATPIPAAVWLFGSGLLGLIGLTKRNRAA